MPLKHIMSAMMGYPHHRMDKVRGKKRRRRVGPAPSTSPPGADAGTDVCHHHLQPISLPPPPCSTAELPVVTTHRRPRTNPDPSDDDGASRSTVTSPGDASGDEAGAGSRTSTSGVVPRWRGGWAPFPTTDVDLNTVPSKSFFLMSVGKGVYGSVYRVFFVDDHGGMPGDTGRLTNVTVQRMFDARETPPPPDRAFFDTKLVLKVSQLDKDPIDVFERLNTAINDVAVHRLAATQCPGAVPAIYAAHIVVPGVFVCVIEAKDTTLASALAKPDGVANAPTLIRSALRAVSGLHSAGVLHLDVKPSNILVDRETMKVTMCDFGLAVRLDGVNCRQLIVGSRPQDRGVRGHKPDVVTPVFRPPDLHACHAVTSAAASEREIMAAIRSLELTGNTDAWCMGRIADSVAKGYPYGIPKRKYVGARADHTAIVSDPAYQETAVGIRSIHTVSLEDPCVTERAACATIAACLLTLRPTLRVGMDMCATNAAREYADLSTRAHPVKPDSRMCLADTHPPGGGGDGDVVITVPMPSLQEASALHRAATANANAKAKVNAGYFFERLLRTATKTKVSARTVIVAMALMEVYGTWENSTVMMGAKVNAMLRFAATREQVMFPTGVLMSSVGGSAFAACVSMVQKAMQTNPDPLLSALPTADLWCVSLTGVATFLRRSLMRGSVIVEDLQAEVNACNLGQATAFSGVSQDPGIKKAIQAISQTAA